MKCTRCKGLMVGDDLLDLQESYLPTWMRAWRCVACGNIVDPVIHHHRTVQHSGALGLVKPDIQIGSLVRQGRAAGH